MATRQYILIGIGAGILFVAVVASGLVFRGSCRAFNDATVQVGTAVFSVAVADTEQERIQGLIGCTTVPETAGMYFTYSSAPQTVTFWTKGMSIPIDIIWIADNQVVGLVDSAPPVEKFAADPPLYRAPVPVDAVLEVAAGTARRLGFTVGTAVLFQE